MSSSFSAQKDYTCTQCHRKADALMHVYRETLEVLVFGLRCQHCRTLSEEVSEAISGFDPEWTVHDAGFDTLWCMHCDKPTRVGSDSMHDHIRDAHPARWDAQL